MGKDRERTEGMQRECGGLQRGSAEAGVQRQECRGRSAETGVRRQECRDRSAETGLPHSPTAHTPILAPVRLVQQEFDLRLLRSNLQCTRRPITFALCQAADRVTVRVRVRVRVRVAPHPALLL